MQVLLVLALTEAVNSPGASFDLGMCGVNFLFYIVTWNAPMSRSHEAPWLVGWLCWGLTSQSTIFQSCRDGTIASWVLNQYFRGVKCLAQGHNTAAVGFEPRTSRSGVRHSTTEPPRSPSSLVVYGPRKDQNLGPHKGPHFRLPKKELSSWLSVCAVFIIVCHLIVCVPFPFGV